MLFDLRSRGRRRTVKTVYVFLALLMGAGLVLFGIGGAVSGGLLNAFNGSSGSSSGNAVAKDVKNLERAVRLKPSSTKAWGRLVTLRYQVAANGNGNFDSSTGAFTAQGKAALAGVDAAWTRYMALKPAKPSVDLASQMEQVYGPAALNQPASVVKTIEFELGATKKPGVTIYERYAVWASQATQTRKAQLAQTQAESLAAAGKTGAARKKAIAAVKQQISAGKTTVQQQVQSATSRQPSG